MGCGTGGSTAVFGMVMERFRPNDFTPGLFSSGCSGSSAPGEWPVSYDEMVPYYEEAERLFRIRGTQDPLAPPNSVALLPPPLETATERNMAAVLSQAGLHPYRIHSACERVPNCTGCVRKLCHLNCRNDSGKILVRPAVEQYGANILSECSVQRLVERSRVVTHAICNWRNREVSVRGRLFVLAANAFFTPALLLKSISAHFPDGLGNSSGLVGRNLMLHLSDVFLAQSKTSPAHIEFDMSHGLAFNDLYSRNGVKLGNIHAHPDKQPVFATILEDLPYYFNKVSVDSGRVSYEYHFPRELRYRHGVFVEEFARRVSESWNLRPLRPLGLPNMTHACGTCALGRDAKSSVVHPSGRMHDLDNIYLVDSSWFPSSGGINPSLTIIANALRVCAQLV